MLVLELLKGHLLPGETIQATESTFFSVGLTTVATIGVTTTILTGINTSILV